MKFSRGEFAPLTERETDFLRRIVGLSADDKQTERLSLTLDMGAELTIGVTQEVQAEVSFLRDLLRSGTSFERAVELIEKVRLWHLDRLGERLSKTLSWRTYRAPTRARLPWHLRAGNLSDQDFDSWSKAHRSLWEHETQAMKRGEAGCECDLCELHRGAQGRIENAARVRANANKARARRQKRGERSS